MSILRKRRAAFWFLPLVLFAFAACDDLPVDGAEVVQADDGSPSIPIEGGYLSSRYAEHRNDWNKAADYTLAILAEEPDNAGILRRAVIFLTAAGRLDEAEPLAQRLVEIAPEETVGRLLLAVEHASDGDFDAAGAQLEGLPANSGNDILVPLFRGWTLMGQDRVDDALTALKELDQARGLAMFQQMHRALMLDMAGRAEAAEESYRTVMGDGDQAPLRAAIAFASLLQRLDRPEEAREVLAPYERDMDEPVLLTAALERLADGEEIEPLVASAQEGLAEGLFDVGSALAEQRALRTAMLYARLALRLVPEHAAAWILIGNMDEQFERYKDALEAYRQVPDDHALAWGARMGIARTLDALDRTDEALELLSGMVEARPARIDAAVASGDLLRRHERFEEAAAAYDTAVERIDTPQPGHWSLFYVRGIAYEQSDQWKKAEDDFLQALELNPEEPYVLNYLAYSWVEQGVHLERAMEMLETAVAAKRDDGYIVDSMGWVLYRTGRYEEAVPHLERAVSLRPHDPTINDHLGDAYWKVGRKTEARFQWKHALAFGPDEELEAEIEAKLEGGLDAAEKADQTGPAAEEGTVRSQ